MTQQINESSLARVYAHTKNRNVGIISADRGENTAEENQAKNQQLQQDLRERGYGFVKIRGRYIENYKTDQENPVDENSILVVGDVGDDGGKLLGHLKELGAKYNQDSILHKSHDSEDAKLHGTKEGGWPGLGKEESVGEFHPARAGEFHTVMKGGRTFAFESTGQLPKVRVEFLQYLLPKSFSRRQETEF